MNGPMRVLLMCIAFAAAAGCNPGPDEQKPKDPPPIKDTIFKDTVVTPLDKARGVEGTVMQQKQEADKAIDASEHGNAQ
jgi:hypothetical protein